MWVLFSYRSMTPLELYYAILSVAGPESGSSIVWDHDVNEKATATSFILSSSKGLIEIVKDQRFPCEPPIVQFIHDSVREHLLSFGMQQLDPALSDNLVGRGNLRLARCCESYLGFSFERLSHLGAQCDHLPPKLGMEYLPLLQYAIEGILRHSDTAAYHGVDVQLSFEENLPPWFLFASRTARPDRPPTALHVLAHKGCTMLAKQYLQRYPPEDLQDYVNKLFLDGPNCSICGTAWTSLQHGPGPARLRRRRQHILCRIQAPFAYSQ